MSQLSQLYKYQNAMGIKRFYKMSGDFVYDTTQNAEIPIENAMSIAKGLSRGRFNDSHSTQDFSELLQHRTPDVMLTQNQQNAAVESYGFTNWINNPLNVKWGNQTLPQFGLSN